MIRFRLIDVMVMVTAISVFLGGMSMFQEYGGLLAFLPAFVVVDRVLHRSRNWRDQHLVTKSLALALASAVGAPITMALYCMALDPGSFLVTTKWGWAEFGFWIVVVFFPLGSVEGFLLDAVATFFEQSGR